MIKLSPHEKGVLSKIGHGPYAKEFIQILEKMKVQVSSLEGMNPGEDHNVAVEGRLLFRGFLEELTKHLNFENRRHRPNDPDAEIGENNYE